MTKELTTSEREVTASQVVVTECALVDRIEIISF